MRAPKTAAPRLRRPGFRSVAVLAVLLVLPIAACDGKPQAGKSAVTPKDTGAAPKPPDTAQAPAPAKDGVKDEVKPSKEYWPNGKLKYFYEMRRNPDGKWARNGMSRAYYDTGELEREGMYKNNTRVGQWKYYDPQGKVIRVEERGPDGQAH
jgi:hypothetical protein